MENSTVEVLQDSDDNFFVWLVKHLTNYDSIFGWVAISISALGILANSVTVDIAKRQRDQTSGTKWMIYLALWDIAYLSLGVCLIFGQEALGVDFRNLGDIFCAFHRIFSNLSTLTASAHLVAMAVDRAVVITFPTWHCNQTWDPIIKRISLAIAGFYFALQLPGFGTVRHRGGVCLVSHTPALTVYRIILVTLFFAITHVVVVFVSSGFFIYKLRERRTPKPKPSKAAPLNEESETSGTSDPSAKTRRTADPGTQKEAPGNTSPDEKKSKEHVPEVLDGFSDSIYMGPNIAPIPTPIRKQNFAESLVEVEVHLPEATSERPKKSSTENAVDEDATKPKEAFLQHRNLTKGSKELFVGIKAANIASSKPKLGTTGNVKESSCDNTARPIDMGADMTSHWEEEILQKGREKIAFCDLKRESVSVKISAIGEREQNQNVTIDTGPQTAETKNSENRVPENEFASIVGKHPRDGTSVSETQELYLKTQRNQESSAELPGKQSEASKDVTEQEKEPQKRALVRQDGFTDSIDMEPDMVQAPTTNQKQQIAESSMEVDLHTRETTAHQNEKSETGNTASEDVSESKEVLLQPRKITEELKELHGMYSPKPKVSIKAEAEVTASGLNAKTLSMKLDETSFIAGTSKSGTNKVSQDDQMKANPKTNALPASFSKVGGGEEDEIIRIGTQPANRNQSKAESRLSDAEKLQTTKKEKPKPVLSEDDVKAIHSILGVCILYLVCLWTAATIFIFKRFASEDIGREGEELLDRIITIILSINNSANFFFYLRANSFRATFKSRYLKFFRLDV